MNVLFPNVKDMVFTILILPVDVVGIAEVVVEIDVGGILAVVVSIVVETVAILVNSVVYNTVVVVCSVNNKKILYNLPTIKLHNRNQNSF